MPNRVVQWCPFNSSSFCAYDGKLKLFELQRGSERGSEGVSEGGGLVLQKLRKNIAKSEVMTIDWFPHATSAQLMAVGNAAGQVSECVSV
jgi:hypothetical protein